MWSPPADYYAILGIDPSASNDEIKAAYRALALRYHPDTSVEQHQTELFRGVHEAYEVLSDPERRKSYDLWREAQRAAEEQQSPIRVTITCSHERLGARQEPQILYVLLDVTGIGSDASGPLPLNLCLALDRSTSMKGARLQKAKEATRAIIDRLGPRDSLSVVSFSDRAEVIVPGGSDIDRIQSKSAVNNIQAGGGTEIFQGLLAAMQQVNRWRSPDRANHVILLTDGQTYGDEQQCLNLAEEAGLRSVSVSCMGIGSEWNDRLLDDIALRSGGTSHYLRDAADIGTAFLEAVTRLANTLAQQIQLEVHPAKGVGLQAAFSLSPELSRLTPDAGRLRLGRLGWRASHSVLLEFLVPATLPGRHRLGRIEVQGNLLSDAKKQGLRIERDIVIDFTDGQPNEDQVPQRIVAALQRISISRMQERAMNDAENGRLAQATRTLETMATRLMDLGEVDLAQVALLEAGRLNRGGALSAEGRKQIKYGTRNLGPHPSSSKGNGT